MNLCECALAWMCTQAFAVSFLLYNVKQSGYPDACSHTERLYLQITNLKNTFCNHLIFILFFLYHIHLMGYKYLDRELHCGAAQEEHVSPFLKEMAVQIDNTKRCDI